MTAVCYIAGKIRRRKEGKIATLGTPHNSSIVTATSMLATVIAFVWAGASIINVIQITQRFSYSRYNADFVAVTSENYGETEARAKLDAYLGIDGVTEGCAFKFDGGIAVITADGTEIIDTIGVNAILDEKDMKYFSKSFSEGTEERFGKTEHPIVIPYFYAQKYGIEVGDTLQIDLTHGRRPDAEFTVVGCDTYVSNWDKTFLISYSDFAIEGTIIPWGNHFFLNGDEGKYSTAIRAGIDDPATYTYVYRWDVYHLNTSPTADIESFLVFIKYFFYAVAALGLVNLIIVSAIDRRREMQIFSLVGMTPSGAFRLTLTEAFIVSLTGLGMGVLVSFAINRLRPIFASLMNRYILPDVFPLEMLVTALVVTLMCFVVWVISPIFATGIVNRKARKSIHNAE